MHVTKEADMNKDNATPEIERDADGFEIEGAPEEPMLDTAWLRDGRGNLVRLEVPDDD